MGIIILPFLLAAFVIWLLATIRLGSLFMAQGINFPILLWGLLLSFSLFGLVVWSYILEKQVWALSPFFKIPTYLFFVPAIAYLVAANIKYENALYFSKILLASICISGILCVIFGNFIFDILKYLGINTYH